MQEHVHKFPIPASGKVLVAINKRARDLHLPLGRAAVSLIEDAISGTTPVVVEPAAPIIENRIVNLEDVPHDEIIDELLGRLMRADDAETDRERADAMQARAEAAAAELAQAVARAEAAEAKLAQVAGVLAASNEAAPIA